MSRAESTGATIDIHIYHHFDQPPSLETLLKGIAMTLAEIQAKVDAEKTVIDSAVALLTSLSQTIRDHANDPAAMQKLADDIDAQTSELAGAVTANTPAATP